MPITTGASFDGAEKNCASVGGHLPAVFSAFQNNALCDFITCIREFVLNFNISIKAIYLLSLSLYAEYNRRSNLSGTGQLQRDLAVHRWKSTNELFELENTK